MLKMINVFLVDGDVHGRKIFKVANNSITLSEFPRNNMTNYDGGNVLDMNCVYFLLNYDTKDIYIGSTKGFKQHRSKDHMLKPYWDTLLVFTSPDFEMYPSLVEDIEDLAISEADKQTLWDNHNKQGGTKRAKEKFWRELCIDYFESIKILANIAGCNLFTSSKVTIESSKTSKTEKSKRVKTNKTNTQQFCIDNRIVTGIRYLLEAFATLYLTEHKDITIESFVSAFNEKVPNSNSFYALEDAVISSKREKLYMEITVNEQKLFVLRQQSGAGIILCPIMTEMGFDAVQVDVNMIVRPCGNYSYSTNSIYFNTEIKPDIEGVILKKGSWYKEKKNNVFEKNMVTKDKVFPTFNSILKELTNTSGNKQFWIYEDGRTLIQIEEELLINQANAER